MKYIIKKNIIALLFLGLFTSPCIHSKVRAIGSRREFEQTIVKPGLVVALFYEDQKRNSQDKQLFQMYEDISSYQPYNDADIVFVKINTARKDLADLYSLYSITKIPSFIFFHNGQRLKNKNNVAIVLDGSISRVDLQSFINSVYGNVIERYIDKKETRKRALIADENESWKYYFYPRDMVVRSYDPAERNLE